MPPRRVVRAPKVDTAKLIVEFLMADATAKQQAARAAQLKDMLRKVVEENGTPDEKGSLWMDVDAVPGVKAIKHERRSSTFLDAAAAEEWCEEHDLDCTETVVRFSEDAFYKLVFDKKIPPKVARSFERENVTWALKVERAK